MRRLSPSVASLLFVLGLGLLALNMVGVFFPPIDNRLGLVRQVPGYHSRSIPPSEALSKVSALAHTEPETKAHALFTLLADSYIHAPSYELKPWDNWFVWLRSLTGKSFRVSSQDIDTLWKRGGGFCRQAALIYAGKAQELGLDARVILLTGHVVAEVFLPEKGWRVVDPDLDIFWDHPLTEFGKTLSTEEIVQRIVARGFSSEYALEVSSLYTSQDNNFIRPFPLDEVRYNFEMTSKYFACWGIPLVLIFLAALLQYSGSTRH